MGPETEDTSLSFPALLYDWLFTHTLTLTLTFTLINCDNPMMYACENNHKAVREL